MGIISWLKGGAAPPPDDRTTVWLRDQIREAAPASALSLAEAAAALAGHGAMAFGMILPTELPARDTLRTQAMLALEALLPALPDDQCEAVFAVIARAKLQVDVTARRAAYEASVRAKSDRTVAWMRDQIAQRASQADVLELAEAWLQLGREGGMVFGMVTPRTLDREPLRAAIVAAVDASVPTLEPRVLEQLSIVAQRTRMPVDFGDRLATLAEEREAERTRAREAAAGSEPRHPELEREIAAFFHADADEVDDEGADTDADADDADDADGAANASETRDADDGRFTVYADWLQAQGHPRGELIAHQLRGAAFTSYLRAHADALLGPLAPHVTIHDGSGREAFTWRRGFIRRAELSNLDDGEAGASLSDILELLFLHPSARYLRELALGIDGEGSGTPLTGPIAMIAGYAPKSLRSLYLGAFEYPDQTEMSWYEIGDLSPLWPPLAGQLRELIVQGGTFELGTLDLPVLERATFRTGGLAAQNVRAIHEARWPALRALEIWYGDENYGGDATAEDVRRLLARSDLPALRHLGLANAAFTDDIVAALAASRLAPQLASLDLSKGTLSDDGAHVLAAAARSLPALRHVDVSQNYLSDAAIAALAAVFPEVEADDQNDDTTDPEDRYPSVGE